MRMWLIMSIIWFVWVTTAFSIWFHNLNSMDGLSYQGLILIYVSTVVLVPVAVLMIGIIIRWVIAGFRSQ